MPRFLLAASLLLVLPATDALGQAPKPPIDLEPARQQVEALLHSPLPKDQAWGAYLIGALSLDDLVPELIRFIQTGEPFGFEGEREFALRAVVDSLIRLEAAPPLDLLLPYYERLTDEIIVLISRDPAPYSDRLLDLLQRTEHPYRRQALIALILRAQTPGVAAWLLEDLTTPATLYVRDSFWGSGGGVSGSSLFACLRGFPVPEGYPSFGVYQVTIHTNVRSVLIGNAPSPVYYTRVLAKPGVRDQPCTGPAALDNKERRSYIAALAGSSALDLPLKLQYESVVYTQTGADIATARRELQEKIHADYAAVIARIRSNGFLTDAEVHRLRPHIEIDTVDQRGR